MISICPGPEPNGIQIPIGNNTGSLPDLTNLQFASPLPNPIDGDENSLQAHGFYSTVSLSNCHSFVPIIFIIILFSYFKQSPNIGSSPFDVNGLSGHMPPLSPMNCNSGNGGLNPGLANGSRGSSPGPSPSQRRRPHHQLQNLQLRSPSHGHSSQNHSHSQSSVSFFFLLKYLNINCSAKLYFPKVA